MTSGRPLVLIFGAPALLLASIGLAPVLGQSLDRWTAAMTLLTLYWAGCLGLARVSARRSLRAMYGAPLNRRSFELLLTWLPPALLLTMFLPSVASLPGPVLMAVFAVALVNGIVEELFWRGTFIATFPDRLFLAWVYPTMLFAGWHVALSLLPGIEYEGGPVALIGGALMMGFVWGLVVLRTRDIRSVTAAHVLTNVFAFGGLLLANGVTG